MADLACKCKDECTHKDLDDFGDRRSFLFFGRVARLIEDYDLPVRVSSALRCPAHNAGVGGSPDSAHIYAVAVDLQPEAAPYALALMADHMAFFNGIIVYPHSGVVHLDLHPSDRIVRGYSFGPKDMHLLRYGNRQDLPLTAVHEWNSSYTIRKPAHVIEAEGIETP